MNRAAGRIDGFAGHVDVIGTEERVQALAASGQQCEACQHGQCDENTSLPHGL